MRFRSHFRNAKLADPLQWLAIALCIVALLPFLAYGQTTTVVTATVKDVSGNVVPTGQVTFDLKPGIDTTVNGNARFTPQTTVCTINQAQNGGTGTITSLVRAAGVVTATFSSQTTFLVGDTLSLCTWSDPTFNGYNAFVVTAVSSVAPWTVTWNQVGVDSTATSGSISALRANPTGPCTVTQNTSLTPAGTYYKVTLWPSFAPTSSFNFYALTNTIDLASVVPTPATVPAFSFVDLFSNQTITGQKTFTQAIIAPNLASIPPASNGIQYVTGTGSDTNNGLTWATAKATCTAATTAAGAAGTVFIGPDVAAAQVCDNPNNVPILDFRQYSTGALGLWHGIDCGMPVTGLPVGNDCPVTAHGSGDIPLTNKKVATTTTAAISVGVNTDILVGSTTEFGTGAGDQLEIGRDTANDEFIAGGSWSIVDATHFTFTAAKTHSGTTDIEQVGSIVLDGRALVIDATNAPAQAPNAPYPIVDLNASPSLFLPRNTEQGGNIEQNILIPAPLHLVFMSGATLPPTSWSDLFRDPTNGILQNNDPSAFPLGFMGPLTTYTASPAASGIVRLADTDAISWRNHANTADVQLAKDTSDNLTWPGSMSFGTLSAGSCVQAGAAGLLTTVAAGCPIVTSFTTTAATTDSVTVTGMTSSGHCQLTPTNSAAAAGIASVFVSAKTTNQITVTHTATAGWTFDVACTPN